MITKLIKLVLGRKITPFRFLPERDFLPSYNVPNCGIYVHIPFCKSLCAFCPYYKVEYCQEDETPFLAALTKEIEMVAKRLGARRAITSVYFGGGSPALLFRSIETIIGTIKSHCEILGEIGMELHPRDATDEVLSVLKIAGVTMVSLGVQSFQMDQLETLGRLDTSPLAALQKIKSYGFKSIDVDLIFGIPGQSGASIKQDFLMAVENGATQVSTYPFIDFSYAHNSQKPLNHKQKKLLLNSLLKVAKEVGFARTSVWTFGKIGTPRYSSVTRDNFIGFGPSATSLGLQDFKINTFSVRGYIDAVQQGILPTALRMHFTKRTRSLYWLFWSSYNGVIEEKTYRALFGKSLIADFGFFLFLGTALKLLTRQKSNSCWTLTTRGSYLFHRIEQIYTHQYIDKTWRSSLKTAWPDKIEID